MRRVMVIVIAGLTLALGGCLTDPDDPELGEESSELELVCPQPIPVPPGIPPETQCDDGIDNDGDGLIDQCDPDCRNDSGCPSCGTDPGL